MKFLTFKGGIHPKYEKEYANDKVIEKLPSPKTVYIPLSQHIGAPAKCIVKVGDNVKLGQKIGQMQGFVSTNIHSSVSGKVTAIKEMDIPSGIGMCVVIENDFNEEVCESVSPKENINELSKEELIKIVTEAGIVGMGGAAFPTHVKLSPPPDKIIDTVILNGAECEPYLTADHRLMIENPQDVVAGLDILMKILDVKKGFIGIETNKMDAIAAVSEAAKNYPNIEVAKLEVKYPQGAEKQLIYACTKREVPSGKLPMDVSVVVNNVATAAQIAKTIKTGMPLIERITTVTGSCIQNPKNVLMKVGTPINEIIDYCGGIKSDKKLGKLILGGPMMGITQYTMDIPTNKATSGILCLSEEESNQDKVGPCIRCGKCVSVCPAFLRPLYISAYSLKNDYDKSEEFRAMDCIECGSCSFVCPARRPLLQSIRNAKREIGAKRRKQASNK